MTPSPLPTTFGRPSARGGERWRLTSVLIVCALGGVERGKVDARKMESLSSKGGEWVWSEGSDDDDDDEPEQRPSGVLLLSLLSVTESQPSSEGWAALTMDALGGMGQTFETGLGQSEEGLVGERVLLRVQDEWSNGWDSSPGSFLWSKQEDGREALEFSDLLNDGLD